MRRSALLFAVVGVGLILAASTAQAQSASLEMTAAPERIVPGEPVTFTITKTNLVPSDLEWSISHFCRRARSSYRRPLARGAAHW
jgi:hypothetical protein